MKKTLLSFFLFTLTSFATATCNLNTPIIDSGFYNQYSPTMISDITSSLAVFQEFFDEEDFYVEEDMLTGKKDQKEQDV